MGRAGPECCSHLDRRRMLLFQLIADRFSVLTEEPVVFFDTKAQAAEKGTVQCLLSGVLRGVVVVLLSPDRLHLQLELQKIPAGASSGGTRPSPGGWWGLAAPQRQATFPFACNILESVIRAGIAPSFCRDNSSSAILCSPPTADQGDPDYRMNNWRQQQERKRKSQSSAVSRSTLTLLPNLWTFRVL